MKKTISTFLIIGCFITIQSIVKAQVKEDILRFSSQGLGVGARSLGLGTAYTSVANDFSAIYWNPAGLGQIQLNEFSVGLSHLSYGDNSTFLNNQQSVTNSATSLNNLGLVYSIPTVRGSLVFALGYGRQADFTTGLVFKGVNPVSSIIQAMAPDGEPYPRDYITRAEYLEIARVDTVNGVFVSPIKNGLTQSGKTLEGGGLSYVSAAAAVEAVRNLYFGVTLNFITGSYSFNRTYREQDLAHRYEVAPFDFSELMFHETVLIDLSGFTATFGALYKFGQNNRVGIAIKTPSWITGRETFTNDATSTFDNGDILTDPQDFDPGTKNEYDLQTPYVFSAGASIGLQNLMIAGDIEYADWSQMEFRNPDRFLAALNDSVKDRYKPTLGIKMGIEYGFITPQVKLRGGFMFIPSPLNGDASSFGQKYITGGFGFILENAIAIDLGYAYGFWDTNHQIYKGIPNLNINGADTEIESIHTHNLVTTLSYRF